MKAKLIIILFTMLACNAFGQSLDINNQGNDDKQNEGQKTVNKQVSVGSEKASAKKNLRNLIKEGNELFRNKRYADAEVKYRKALEIDPNSEHAQYNLATTLLSQGGNTNPNDESATTKEAVTMLENLIKTGQLQNIVEKAYYNLGNLAYNKEQYQQSIELYKNALRRNPDNDKARENLRLAQLKLQQQQQNQNNQDQNKDQDKQDQQKQQQDQQKQQQQQQNQEKQKQDQQKQQQQPAMSDANAEKILKAMENEEAKTRQRIEAQKAREQNTQRRSQDKPW